MRVLLKKKLWKKKINEYVFPSTSGSINKNEFISVESRQSQPFVTILGQSESVISTTQINSNQIESQFKSKNTSNDQSVTNNKGKPASLSTFIDELTVLTSTFPKFENDKGLYENCSTLNEDKIRALLLAGPCQPK